MFLIQFFMLFHDSLHFVLHGSLINCLFKDFYGLLKKMNQSKNGLKSYNGEQNKGYQVKEHKKVVQKHVSKVTLHFIWGHLSSIQTVTYV